MSMSVEFRPVTDEIVAHVAQHMREADRVEIWASSRLEPHDCLRASVMMSDYTAALVADAPIAVIGLVRDNTLCGCGVPWLMGTDEIDDHAVAFVRACREMVQEMRKICPHLMNYVHEKNEKSVRFLESMGFMIEDPVPFGAGGEFFHRFHMGEV